MNYVNYILLWWPQAAKVKNSSDGTCSGETLGGFSDVGFVVGLHLEMRK